MKITGTMTTNLGQVTDVDIEFPNNYIQELREGVLETEKRMVIQEVIKEMLKLAKDRDLEIERIEIVVTK